MKVLMYVSVTNKIVIHIHGSVSPSPSYDQLASTLVPVYYTIVIYMYNDYLVCCHQVASLNQYFHCILSIKTYCNMERSVAVVLHNVS